MPPPCQSKDIFSRIEELPQAWRCASGTGVRFQTASAAHLSGVRAPTMMGTSRKGLSLHPQVTVSGIAFLAIRQLVLATWCAALSSPHHMHEVRHLQLQAVLCLHAHHI